MLLITLLLAATEIHLYFDGTLQDDSNDTNIFKLFAAFPGVRSNFATQAQDGVAFFQKVDVVKKKLALYLPGIGFDLNDFQCLQFCYGGGMELRSLVAYEFLVKHKALLTGNYKLRMFGFSRGAATARMLANYLDLYGVLASNTLRVGGTSPLERTFLTPTLPSKIGQKVIISSLGLFDTVLATDVTKAVAKMPLSIPLNVLQARQAYAINEYRSLFKLITISGAPNRKQKAFVGAHSDIGGDPSGPNAINRPRLALHWMITDFMDPELRNVFLPLTLSLTQIQQYSLVGITDKVNFGAEYKLKRTVLVADLHYSVVYMLQQKKLKPTDYQSRLLLLKALNNITVRCETCIQGF